MILWGDETVEACVWQSGKCLTRARLYKAVCEAEGRPGPWARAIKAWRDHQCEAVPEEAGLEGTARPESALASAEGTPPSSDPPTEYDVLRAHMRVVFAFGDVCRRDSGSDDIRKYGEAARQFRDLFDRLMESRPKRLIDYLTEAERGG